MSITLGIYDFFSYIIPGLLYLYVFNELFRILGWKYIAINSWIQSGQTPSLIFLIPLLIVVFIVGHIFDPIAHKFYGLVSRFRHSPSISAKSLASVKNRYPNLKVQFESIDWSTLFVLIRVRNLEVSKYIDKFNADAIMLRNVAFGLLLLTIDYLLEFFSNGLWDELLIALITIILSTLALSRSNHFRLRFFKQIFRASLAYGKSLEEVIEYKDEKPRPRKPLANKKSKKAL